MVLDKEAISDIQNLDFDVQFVGKPTIQSPLSGMPFVSDDARISYLSDVATLESVLRAGKTLPSFVAAGPRERIYHDPTWTRAAIVTCGGLCPGINDVIKGLVNTLYRYGVQNVFGIRYGYRGLIPTFRLKPLRLDPDSVDLLHENGGSLLGSSRGEQPTEEIVRTLDRLNINILFTIGGDGTQRGASDIAGALAEKNRPVSVIGVPKTIDNDLNFMARTFGFETAVYASEPVISCAHDEAKGAYNGIGLVRLMGRDSGFIAASASLANSVVNFCLVPEVPFQLDGPRGLLAALERRLEEKHHAVIVVAEGAGQELVQARETEERDASGNLLHKDIGLFLNSRITAHLKERGVEHSVKYFDPSYIIRSIPARGTDAVFCLHLAQHAVHAAMAGMTNVVIGHWHDQFTCVPIHLATRSRRKIQPQGQLWQSVLHVTQQEQYLDG